MSSNESIKSEDMSTKCQAMSEELEQVRAKCRKAENERDKACEELKTLEKEMEEMHDNFKEEESEQFEQLKQELDLAIKNCKILQIRLNKSERQYNQLEQVKTMLEQQLEESASRHQTNSETSSAHMNFVQVGTDFVKLPTREYDQLLRDLNDTTEREKDLQEQIKFSQEEVQLKGDRLLVVEAENELLLNKVNKLMVVNQRLRSLKSFTSNASEGDSHKTEEEQESSELVQQDEQLKLALELAQNECERLKTRWQETRNLLEQKEAALKESEDQRSKLANELLSIRASSGLKQSSNEQQGARLELECRQLRTRLVQTERECKQLKVQLEMSSNARQLRGNGERVGYLNSSTKSQSMEYSGVELQNKQHNKELMEQCDSLKARNLELEKRIRELSSDQNVSQAMIEFGLLDKLKRQLDSSENELAKARSRLVELDLECGKAQRQYKRLMDSLEKGTKSEPNRKTRLPDESMGDSMSRHELRQTIKDLEAELNESLKILRSRDCLIQELRAKFEGLDESANDVFNKDQLKSLRQIIEQERATSFKLEQELGQVRKELETNKRVVDRERSAIEEELEKLRQLNNELNMHIDSSKKNELTQSLRIKDLESSCEKMRSQLAALKSRSVGAQPVKTDQHQIYPREESALLARDLNELKVKNNFLLRQLDIAREDTTKQLDDVRRANEAQLRRAVEMAKIELKESQLEESQQLRDEVNDLKQRLVSSQRELSRAQEEISASNDRLRSMERDWRREKSQCQQQVEQLESQLNLERRSNEFKAKECESLLRDKERELIGVQDKYVQLERDLKRLQNKYSLLEENSVSKEKTLIRELEAKKRELNDSTSKCQTREEDYYDKCKRFNNEKATLLEALESIKRSYDEKLAELKSARDLLALRQDQSYKERLGAQDRIEELSSQLIKMAEYESQSKVAAHQLQTLERQLENLRRECQQLKEDRMRLKTQCDGLEKRCQQYEKQELIAKTSSISGSSNLFLKAKNSFQSAKESTKRPTSATDVSRMKQDISEQADSKNQCLMIEKLSSKINDQRHLIRMLKDQLAEHQSELKQAKLMHSLERNKWQNKIGQMTSRINECEEKLLFESSSLVKKETFESSRRKLELKWADEREAKLEAIQQQQNQNEMLARELRKLSQSHDLLRLHAKQIEAYNSKLSGKLIEYQQQASPPISNGNELGQKLEKCLADRENLVARQEELTKKNTRLIAQVQEKSKPLIETVSKMVAAFESIDEKASKQAGEDRTTRGYSAIPPTSINSDENKSTSTFRPLLTSRQPQHSEDDNSNSIDFVSTAPPAHQLAGQQNSRLKRFLGSHTGVLEDATRKDKANDSGSSGAPVKRLVKRVRIKSSTLGITASEKKQLKQNLESFVSALDQLNSPKSSENKFIWSQIKQRDSQTGHNQANLKSSLSPSKRSELHSDLDSESAQSRVHWQLDSDNESNRSWSIGNTNCAPRTNNYRRFPQGIPSSVYVGGSSLTDCDSESSLASDISSYSSQRRFVSGTESDSCVGHHNLKSPKKRGLRLRLTNTLRNISKSITGLASDSEIEHSSLDLVNENEKSSKKDKNNRISAKEIRV